jgi:hypothetical protein
MSLNFFFLCIIIPETNDIPIPSNVVIPQTTDVLLVEKIPAKSSPKTDPNAINEPSTNPNAISK